MNTQFIFCIVIISLFTGCKRADLKIELPDKEPVPIQKICYIENVADGNKILISINFIEYGRMSDLNPVSVGMKIIELPDGTCYFDREKKIEVYEVSDTCQITMQTFSQGNDGNYTFNQKVGLNDFLKYFENRKSPGFLSSPFYIEITGNKVSSLKEIYIP